MGVVSTEDKIILKKEVLVSVILLSIICYITVFVISFIGTSIMVSDIPNMIESEGDELTGGVKIGLNIGSMMLPAILSGLLSTISILLIFFIALKKNSERFELTSYKYKLTYLMYIFIFSAIIGTIISSILAGEFNPWAPGILPFIGTLILPKLIK